MHPPLRLVGKILGTVSVMTGIANPGEALGGSLVSGLVALAPEASEHNRLMLELEL